MDPEQPPNAQASELEQRLLELAKHDRIPAALSARMAEGLGVHVAGAVVHGGLAAGSHAGAPWFAKTGLWGVLSVALIGGVATWYARPAAPHATHAAQRAQHLSSAPPAIEQAAEPAPPPAVNAPVVTAQAAPAREPVAAPARARAASGGDAALRAEVALLDRARAALHAHAGAQALRLLDRHQRRFAHGILVPEAEALRIEALVQLGARAQAETMSQRFVAAYPQHPLSDRVARLVK
jgi:hypothetical protein